MPIMPPSLTICAYLPRLLFTLTVSGLEEILPYKVSYGAENDDANCSLMYAVVPGCATNCAPFPRSHSRKMFEGQIKSPRRGVQLKMSSEREYFGPVNSPFIFSFELSQSKQPDSGLQLWKFDIIKGIFLRANQLGNVFTTECVLSVSQANMAILE